MTRGFEYAKGNPFGKFPLPKRQTAGAAGYDFTAPYPFVIAPGETLIVTTWVKTKMPKGEYLKIYARSSWGVKRKLHFQYSGIIDSDYYGNSQDDGNIALAIKNDGDVEQRIEAGERIAQGIFMKYLIVDDDEATGERSGGFGSTGR